MLRNRRTRLQGARECRQRLIPVLLAGYSSMPYCTERISPLVLTGMRTPGDCLQHCHNSRWFMSGTGSSTDLTTMAACQQCTTRQSHERRKPITTRVHAFFRHADAHICHSPATRHTAETKQTSKIPQEITMKHARLSYVSREAFI